MNFFKCGLTSVLCTIMLASSVSGYTIRTDHPRLLVTSDDVSFLKNIFIKDGDMAAADCQYWADMGAPSTKEKASLNGNQRLHLISGYSTGAQQTITFKSGMEYEYRVSVYLVSGRCKAQLYQGGGNLKTLFDTTTTGEWQTFTGTFTPYDDQGALVIRFYSYLPSGESEFYIDDVSFRRTGNPVIDNNMELSDCQYWANMGSPSTKEKADYDGSRRLHITAGYSSGATQNIVFEPGIEYEYSVSVYLVSGRCRGQLYQSGGNLATLLDTTTTGQWQTFTGNFIPESGNGPLTIRFYGYDPGGNSEFYIDDVSFRKSGNLVADHNMERDDISDWSAMGVPVTFEKSDYDSSRRLHVVAGYSQGGLQNLFFEPGAEYEYSFSAYLASGRCKAQFYQAGGNSKQICDTTTTGQLQTFTGTYVPEESLGQLALRFYGYQPGSNSEFYIDDLVFKKTGNIVKDREMDVVDCQYWANMGTPTAKEKAVFDGGSRLHIVADYGQGAAQTLAFEPGVEHEYSVTVYLADGRCKGQLYQPGGNIVQLFDTTTTGEWQTFTGTYTPQDGLGGLVVRFYAYDPGASSEFYIDDVVLTNKTSISEPPNYNLRSLMKYALAVYNDGTPNPSPADLADQDKMIDSVRSIALAAMISGDSRLIDLTIDYALAIAAKAPSSGSSDIPQRQRLLSMAYIYDWLYDELTSTEKETLRASMVAHMDYLDYFVNNPVFTGGHSRYGHTVFLGALLALYGEYGTDTTYCNGLLTEVVDNWENGFNPFQAWVANEGGYHMGWKYGASYVSPEPYMLWKSATGEAWGETWREKLGYFFIYGLRGDDTYPAAGDAWDVMLDDLATEMACFSSAALGNRYALEYLNKHNQGYAFDGYLWRYLCSNVNNSEVQPQLLSYLPQARNFGNSGYVVARDKWDDANATHMIFKSTPFYTINHQHKDQNSLVLHYKGPLLIDSGSYDPYGTTHWKNYFTRTIAHNTLIVEDSTETFYYFTEAVSNDGGQKFFDYNQTPVGYEPWTLEEITNYTKYQFGGITSFTQDSAHCYAKGDASKAYSSDKVDTYTREVNMVYESNDNSGKPLINIKDHVVLNKTLTPKIIFHCENQPVVDLSEKWIKIENSNGGGVKIEVASPANVTFNVVGGSGYEFMVDGVNYTPNYLTPAEPGAWRVEVSTTSAVTSADFEFNLKIYDVQ